jgi:hypothetical protein
MPITNPRSLQSKTTRGCSHAKDTTDTTVFGAIKAATLPGVRGRGRPFFRTRLIHLNVENHAFSMR